MADVATPRIALVSKALHPFGGGGIGVYAWSAARLLRELGEVTLITSSAWREGHERLRADGDELALPGDVRVSFLDEPEVEEVGTHYSDVQLYSQRVFERLLELFPGGGPDLVEFGDYHAEGFVTTQARRTLDPRLRNTRVCVRTHTTAEIARLLNGDVGDDLWSNSAFDMERYVLANADALVYAGGDVLGTYERYYADLALAPAWRIRHPLSQPGSRAEQSTSPPGGVANGPLRMLYFGRLERRKGVENLVEAATALSGDDWTLTLLGADTHTGPLRTSMRHLLELSAEGDERIRFADAVPREQLPAVIAAHDVVVLPSLWECWPYVALEAMRLDRPVVATRTGGFTDLVDDSSGWLTRDTTAAGLYETLEVLVGDPAAAREKTAAHGPRRRFEALADEGAILDGYRALLDELPAPRATAPPRRARPLVSAVVSYYELDEFVERAVASLLAQTHDELEVIVVNDGSFREEDRILEELAERWPITVLHRANAGLGAARNFGISQARGRYVLPMDSDNELEPTFVERCLPLLEHDPEVAYVTSWSRFIDEDSQPFDGPSNSYFPLGNWSRVLQSENVAGDATAVIPRQIFDAGHTYSTRLTSFEDWAFYRELAGAGLYGHVVPERLLRYRIRAKSMLREIGLPHNRVLTSERDAHVRERGVAWQLTNA